MKNHRQLEVLPQHPRRAAAHLTTLQVPGTYHDEVGSHSHQQIGDPAAAVLGAPQFGRAGFLWENGIKLWTKYGSTDSNS